MTLPVTEALPQLTAALRAGCNAVLVAPPGAGKTTGVPPALLAEPWCAGQRIILLSPRRLAARAAAARMATLLKEPVGGVVGYRVRLDRKVSERTRIEVVTEGVFTRQILAEPDLPGVAAVLFDEIHERSLEGDLGLALAFDAQASFRADLRLVAMSATLDGARVAALMGGAPVIELQGRMFPVETRYAGRDQAKRIEAQVAEVVLGALREEQGSVLAFLPGAAEIERAGTLLAERLDDPAVVVHRLYGARDSADQSAAIAPSSPGTRKVVLATSIAETSLTIDGVRIVVDFGLARRPRFEPATGLTRLETVKVSQAAATQRQGRAGRLEAGICVRLWDEPQTRALLPFDPSEILDADLSGLALDLAQWETADPATLRWLDPPPAAAFSEARALLTALDALDAEGNITDHGKALAALPLPPRLAHMILASGPDRSSAARIAALIGERGVGGSDTDLRTRLERLDRDRSPRALAIKDQARRWSGGSGSADAEAAGACLMLAWPDRVAKARAGQRGAYLLANGRGARLDPADPLAGEPYLAVAELAGAAEQARILLAAPVSEAAIAQHLGGHIVERDETTFDARLGTVRASRARRLGALLLSDKPLTRPDLEALCTGLITAVRAGGFDLIPAMADAHGWLARVRFLHDHGGLMPDLSDAALLARLEDWFPVALGSADRMGGITAAALIQGWSLLLEGRARELDRLAPARFETPAGPTHAIDYAADGGPAVEVRLQELFGLATHPCVANGIPLTIRLLSPGHRPVQTTKDLPGFWRGSYAAVRTEMRGRYPKHPWPEDPLAATPTTRAKPRGT